MPLPGQGSRCPPPALPTSIESNTDKNNEQSPTPHREGLEVGLLKALLVAKHAADGARPAGLDAQNALGHSWGEEAKGWLLGWLGGRVKDCGRAATARRAARARCDEGWKGGAARFAQGARLSKQGRRLAQSGGTKAKGGCAPGSSRPFSSHRHGCTPKNGSDAAHKRRWVGRQCDVGRGAAACLLLDTNRACMHGQQQAQQRCPCGPSRLELVQAHVHPRSACRPPEPGFSVHAEGKLTIMWPVERRGKRSKRKWAAGKGAGRAGGQPWRKANVLETPPSAPPVSVWNHVSHTQHLPLPTTCE